MIPAWCASLILILIVLAFFCAFEFKKPQARELVLTAQLCALSICARLIFSFVPYFNPVMGILFLCGAGVGVRRGFIAGAMTALVSNFFLGQGPWTLYQMVSWGFVAVIAGTAVKLHLVAKVWSLKDLLTGAALSFLTVVCVTGPLMDLSSVILYGINLKAALAGGFVMNVMLGVSSAVTVAAVGGPFLRIVKRVGV